MRPKRSPARPSRLEAHVLRGIPAGKRKCGSCGRDFADGETFRSVLFLEEDCWVRSSYCDACWSKAKPEGVFAHWVSTARRPSIPSIPPESLIEILMRLLENPEKKGVSYLLAWELARRRILKHRGGKTTEGSAFELFDGRRGERCEVERVTPDAAAGKEVERLLASVSEG
jgi:hypothetical protein